MMMSFIIWTISSLTACGVAGQDPYRWKHFDYWIPNERLFWQNASGYCKQHGGNLASIKDRNENDVIRKVILRYEAEIDYNIWIGLNDVRKEGQYVWTDRTRSPFRNWSPGEPNNKNNNEDCVHMTRYWEWTWNDNICDQEMKFICKIERSTTKIVCEGSKLVITCPVGTIKIIYANYGRRSTTICAKHYRKNCTASGSLQTVKTACEGKTSCSLNVKNAVFGDPCEQVPKYLEVRYHCLSENQGVEDNPLKEKIKKLHYILIGFAVLSLTIIVVLAILIFFLKKSSRRIQKDPNICRRPENVQDECYTEVISIPENESKYQSLRRHQVIDINENHPSEIVAQDRGLVQATEEKFPDNESKYQSLRRHQVIDYHEGHPTEIVPQDRAIEQAPKKYDDVADEKEQYTSQDTIARDNAVDARKQATEQDTKPYEVVADTEKEDTEHYIQLFDNVVDIEQQKETYLDSASNSETDLVT